MTCAKPLSQRKMCKKNSASLCIFVTIHRDAPNFDHRTRGTTLLEHSAIQPLRYRFDYKKTRPHTIAVGTSSIIESRGTTLLGHIALSRLEPVDGGQSGKFTPALRAFQNPAPRALPFTGHAQKFFQPMELPLWPRQSLYMKGSGSSLFRSIKL